jgi:tRNA(Leu) C34 or U34 (ribose-2'-O)-methylase TrmL
MGNICLKLSLLLDIWPKNIVIDPFRYFLHPKILDLAGNDDWESAQLDSIADFQKEFTDSISTFLATVIEPESCEKVRLFLKFRPKIIFSGTNVSRGLYSGSYFYSP